MIDKFLVKKRFEKSLDTYDENAIIQNYMGAKLIDLLKKYKGDKFKRIFEFGVGSANLTKLIVQNISYEELILNDIVKKSQNWAKKYVPDFEFIEGDIEKVDFPEDLDLVISNAAIQWVDFDRVLNKIAKSFKSGSTFAFSTFGEGNFQEINKIFGVGLQYFSPEVLREKLSKHFNVIYMTDDFIELDFPTPKEVLKHIRNTGVNCCGRRNFYKSSLLKFDKEYKKQFSSQDGVKLTYHPICAIVEKV